MLTNKSKFRLSFQQEDADLQLQYFEHDETYFVRGFENVVVCISVYTDSDTGEVTVTTSFMDMETAKGVLKSTLKELEDDDIYIFANEDASNTFSDVPELQASIKANGCDGQ